MHLPQRLELDRIVDNLLCTFLFGANTFTSMQPLSFLSVTTFTIIRDAQSILCYGGGKVSSALEV